MLLRIKSNKSGFTLLELIIVVAILAVIGGSLISSYDGLQAQAAKATATNSIAAVDQAVRNFVVTEGSLPDNLESLMSGDPRELLKIYLEIVLNFPMGWMAMI